MESTIDKQTNMIGLIILVCLVIGGCGMKVNTSGNNITVVYHPKDSSRVFGQAWQICESKGMDVKYVDVKINKSRTMKWSEFKEIDEGTACSSPCGLCIPICRSFFECVAR